MRVVVIDTGFVQTEKNYYNFRSINGISIKSDGTISNNFNDSVGHGTLICHCLHQYLDREIDLFIIKIFDNDICCDTNLLLKALEYCENNIQCEIIQISLGTLYTDAKLYHIVQRLSEKGVLIVAAFNNEESISYPAAYHEVLGLDVSKQYKHIEEFDILQEGVIDVHGADVYYRLKDIDDRIKIVQGSSFYCGYITALLINNGLDIGDKTKALEILKKRVVHIFEFPKPEPPQKTITLKKAVIFPFNKEIHSMAAFEHLLPFEVVSFLDIRQKGKIGRSIKDLLPYSNSEKIIQNIEHLDWESDFDTFICGHVKELGGLIGNGILDTIAQKCSFYNKNLICFDNGQSITDKYPDLKVWFPVANGDTNLLHFRLGKLRSPGIPIVGVFGTSSQQGKMTLQLLIREEFQKQGVKVKNIGSEPESILFGFEAWHVFGYDATDYTTPETSIMKLNETVYELEKEDCELIIAGSQSGTVPHQLRNVKMIPLKQYYFLLGTQPDSIILCANSFDSIEYIQRTVRFFEDAVKAKVICLCVSYLKKRGFYPPSNPLTFYQENFDFPVLDLQTVTGQQLTTIIKKYYGD